MPSGASDLRWVSLTSKSSQRRRISLADARDELWVMLSSLPALPRFPSLCRAERGISGGSAWPLNPRDAAGDPPLALGMNSGSCSLHFLLFLVSPVYAERSEASPVVQLGR